MTAQRKRRRYAFPRRLWRSFILLGLLLVFGAFFIYFLGSSESFFKSDSKLSVAVPEGGDVSLFVLDKENHEMVEIVLPGDTLVDLAQNYGRFKLKNVTRFAKSQGLGGDLLTKTISRNFKFPVYAWGEGLLGIFRGNFVNTLTALVRPQPTNLSIRDRLAIAFFSLTTPSNKKTSLNLARTSYLVKSALPDGEEGYLIKSEEPPLKIVSLFSSEDFYNKGYKIFVTDASGGENDLEVVAKIIEALGSKVVSFNREKKDVEGCQVLGEDEGVVKKLARIFGCNFSVEDVSEREINLVLGRDFKKIF